MFCFLYFVLILVAFATTNFLCAEDSAEMDTVLDRLERLEAELDAVRLSKSNNAKRSTQICPSVSSCGRFFGGAELTVLAPQAGTLSATGTILGNPIGSMQLTPKYGSFAAGRYWGGYRNNRGLGLRFRDWDYNASASGTLGSDPIDTNYSARAIDVETTQLFDFGWFNLDGSLGLRWGETSRYASVPDDASSSPILAFSQSMGGLGPTAAIRGRRTLGQSCWSLIGGGRTSLLFGNNHYSGSFNSVADVTLTAQHATAMVYEIQSGLEWSRVSSGGRRYFAQVMGEAQAWQVSSAAFGLLDSTTGLAGFSTGAGVNW
ncbi:MAG: hypothetical protein ABL921_25275 [Pirellula sp.]